MLKKIFKKIPEDFDITIYLRYKEIIDLVNKDKNIEKIAEVGSGSFGLGPYLKRDFTGFDLGFSKNKSKFLKPVISSATKVPVSYHNKFDLVVSVDMLEHLPVGERPKAIKNMVLLSRKYVFLAFPSGKKASRVDRVLDNYYLKTHHRRLGFLEEHLENPLPDLELTKNQLKQAVSDSKKTLVSLEVKNNTASWLYLSLLFLGFSQKSFLTRIYSLTFFIRDFLSIFKTFPYRKIIILTLK